MNGPATGGGLSIAIASDMRIGTENARFACSYLNLGLGGADVGSSYFLPKILGAAHAADMLYSGRIIDAAEAKEMGLITRIVSHEELLPAAIAIAEGIVRKASPMGLRLTKQVLNETVERHSARNSPQAREPQPGARQPDRGRHRSPQRLVRKTRPAMAR